MRHVAADRANVYEDARRAQAYAGLGFPNTCFLAFRDLPALLAAHARGRRAVDFGCGAGRSTRFLKALGFDAVGIDVAAEMVQHARRLDPAGDYRVVAADETGLDPGVYDLVLAAFTFDNIAGPQRPGVLRRLARLLADDGALVLVGSTPDIYLHEWASFSTRDFPENRAAQDGGRVRIVMKDVDDARPVEDVLWTPEGQQRTFAAAGLVARQTHHPLGRRDEPFAWVNEARIAPWVVHVLGKAPDAGA